MNGERPGTVDVVSDRPSPQRRRRFLIGALVCSLVATSVGIPSDLHAESSVATAPPAYLPAKVPLGWLLLRDGHVTWDYRGHERVFAARKPSTDPTTMVVWRATIPAATISCKAEGWKGTLQNLTVLGASRKACFAAGARSSALATYLRQQLPLNALWQLAPGDPMISVLAARLAVGAGTSANDGVVVVAVGKRAPKAKDLAAAATLRTDTSAYILVDDIPADNTSAKEVVLHRSSDGRQIQYSVAADERSQEGLTYKAPTINVGSHVARRTSAAGYTTLQWFVEPGVLVSMVAPDGLQSEMVAVGAWLRRVDDAAYAELPDRMARLTP